MSGFLERISDDGWVVTEEDDIEDADADADPDTEDVGTSARGETLPWRINQEER